MEWLRGRQTACPEGVVKLQGWDLNPRPQGYEPCELPGCSTLRSVHSIIHESYQFRNGRFLRNKRGPTYRARRPMLFEGRRIDDPQIELRFAENIQGVQLRLLATEIVGDYREATNNREPSCTNSQPAACRQSLMMATCTILWAKTSRMGLISTSPWRARRAARCWTSPAARAGFCCL